eukprot:m.129822 g.129822  ORF g.129822 m.129822 type:complete len:494 (+) comp16420_c0_seq1:99-1580(+)
MALRLVVPRAVAMTAGVRQLATAAARLAPVRAAAAAATTTEAPATTAAASSGQDMLAARMTTLSSGLRVISRPHAGVWSTVGVMANAGSRFESDAEAGCAHILERLAFKSTKNRSQDDMTNKLEQLGGFFMCTGNKESLIYFGAVLPNRLDETVEILAETATRPQITDEELELQKIMTGMEVEDANLAPAVYLNELVHQAAYGSDGLGRSHVLTPNAMESLTADAVRKYNARLCVPSRLVLAGCGIDHDELCRLGERYFPANEASPKTPLHPAAPSKFTPSVLTHNTHESPSNNPLRTPLTHVFLGFEGPGYGHKDTICLALLQTIFGGGHSFSSGGPGKGLFSRFHTNVLNQYFWIENASTVYMPYRDTSLFIVQGASPPEKVGHLMQVLMSELSSTVFITATELNRAQNQLKSIIHMNNESRVLALEDIGRQVLLCDGHISPDELSARIDAVTSNDIVDVLARMRKTVPAIATFGDVRYMPNIESFGYPRA